MKILPDKIIFFIPTQDCNGTQILAEYREQIMDEAITPLIVSAGGGTEQLAGGLWVNSKDRVQSEAINLFTIFCDLKDLGGLKTLIATAAMICLKLKQESVAFELNGKLYLVGKEEAK
jgi:hypothetical protein